MPTLMPMGLIFLRITGAEMKKNNLKPQQNKRRRNEKGMALLETIPILIVFIVIIAYGLGSFGVVHTGILHSISARAYAFETFRNRPNVVYFRDRATGNGYSHFANKETRVHGINSDIAPVEGEIFATTRPIAFGRQPANTQTSAEVHNQKIVNKGDARFRRGEGEASPAWIMVGYGICINANCGE
jgi:hypothetical protein